MNDLARRWTLKIKGLQVTDVFPLGSLATARCGGHAGKQAGKALRSQGHPHRTKRPRIVATLKENKSMYKNKSGYVHRWIKPWTVVTVPQG